MGNQSESFLQFFLSAAARPRLRLFLVSQRSREPAARSRSDGWGSLDTREGARTPDRIAGAGLIRPGVAPHRGASERGEADGATAGRVSPNPVSGPRPLGRPLARSNLLDRAREDVARRRRALEAPGRRRRRQWRRRRLGCRAVRARGDGARAGGERRRGGQEAIGGGAPAVRGVRHIQG